MIERSMKETNLPRVAVVTPSYGRAEYLSRTFQYFRAQQCPGARLRWFVLDDSPSAHPFLSTLGMEELSYRWEAERLELGAKRNRLNDMAMAWNAEYICAMDDDDWYGPSYVSDMIGMLKDGVPHFAGSSQNYYYDVPTGDILLAPTAPPMSSGNGVLCYTVAALEQARYPDSARYGEDRIFLGDSVVLQHPNISLVHLALLHGRNTEDKTDLLRAAQIQKDMSLASFPMNPEDMRFYSDLTDAAVKLKAAR